MTIEIRHYSMFRVSSENEQGYIQCVIKPAHREAFEKLGFRSSIDDARKVKVVKKKAVANDSKG